MRRALHFSAQTCKWATGDGVFQDLHTEFNFTVDVCAIAENTKCERYISPDQDGLLVPWHNETCWCNPPYGNRIADWCQKALLETQNGATTIMLLPARTDTRWFHEYILGKSEVRFIKGRLKFGGSKHNAPFPSMVVVYRAKK